MTSLIDEIGLWTPLDDGTVRDEVTGTIINDRYTFVEYISRRVGFLSSHQDYKHRNDLFKITRDDAWFLFTSEREELCVQKIRAREILHGLKPLLPLPTSENTQTIDNFASYPPQPQPNIQVAPVAPAPDKMSAHPRPEVVTARADSPKPIDTVMHNTPITDAPHSASTSQGANSTVANIIEALGRDPVAQVVSPKTSESASLPFRTGNSPNRSPSPTITSRRNRKDLKINTPPPPSAQPSHPDPSPLTAAVVPRSAHQHESIINGATQPKSRAQAQSAQLELLKRLIAEDPEAVSFPPEFHRIPDVQDITKVEDRNEEEEEEYVSCVCNSKEEPHESNGNWIGCESCRVWQHELCMGDAVPADKVKKNYYCQVCSPYAHRFLLQQIRSGQWVKEDVVKVMQDALPVKKSKKPSRMSAPANVGKKRKRAGEEDDDYKATNKKGTAAHVTRKRRSYA